MAKYLNEHSSNRRQSQRLLSQSQQTTVLASCYSVEASTSTVTGFHYCTMMGTGRASPELDLKHVSMVY
ncbi:hypothetical protein PHISCL_07182 [Aspergillus sclerotialis]|uniref:Uncharacterized protein n=1 Tax=Aspergillus sclerotialis TaxID=2070753 RepID=A0A3A2ZBE7_9EURO|nr:hypothetical protein PHISCL_07182 [Aspergillus sclerotialis]